MNTIVLYSFVCVTKLSQLLLIVNIQLYARKGRMEFMFILQLYRRYFNGTD